MIEPLETRIAPAGAPVVSLSDFASPQGLKLNGAAPFNWAGSALGVAGDVNGDGFDDFLIGASGPDPGNVRFGECYVVFGRGGLFPGALDLSALDGTTGFRISGAVPGDYSGISVSGAGDVNGDGFADLIVGADSASPHGIQSGAAYVIFGKATPFAPNLVLGKLKGSDGFRLNGGTAYDRAGFSVGGAGDVNGDGFSDVIVGAKYADPNGNRSGAAYVVFGKAGRFASRLDLSRLNGRTGFKLNGVADGDNAGWTVSGAGDVNGDGFADVLIGAPGADPNGDISGAAYVVFGKAAKFASQVGLNTLDGTTGFRISGGAAGDRLGEAASAAGDVNGDGFADVIIGARYAAANGTGSGAAYVIFGRKMQNPGPTFPADLPVAALGGNDGFKLSGVAPDDNAGVSVRGAGDVNGDGLADLLIGADGADPNGSGSGATYLVFGRKGLAGVVVNLSTLDGTNGFQLNGVTAGDRAGRAVSPAGDVNHDGFADLLIGAPFSDAALMARGAAYLVFGQAGGFGATLELGSLHGFSDHTGFQLSGAAAGDFAGRSVSGVGDVNGDGFADVVIGAFGADANKGAAYVVFGRATGLPADLDLTTLNGTNGFKISGEAAGDYAGRAVGAAGDINGDGFADLLIGAYTAAPNGAQSGAAYVVFGKGTTFAGTLDLATLNGTNGFKIPGLAAGDRLGRSLSAAGDVNGDGLDDVIVGAPGFAGQRGAAYVILGRTTGFGATFDLATLAPGTGFQLTGETAGDLAGFAVSTAGDVNGDGRADVLIGAFASASESGAAYVVFGPRSGNFPTNLDLATLDGINGFKLNGLAKDKRLGRSVSGLGDVNADGFADFILGAPDASAVGNTGGAAYVIFGRASGFAAALDVTTLTGGNGFALSGVAAGDEAGSAVSGPGDVNGDGFPDIAIGAIGADGKAGATYVIFGRPSGFAADFKLSSLDGANGFKIGGEALTDELGRSVSAAGDLNGDGLADLLVGASGAAANKGASYVIFGAKSVATVMVGARGRLVVTDADGDPVTIAFARSGFARVTFALNGDIGTLELIHTNLASKLAISVPKNRGTTIGHLLVTNGPGAAPEHFGTVKLGPGVILGDGTIGAGAALEITGKTKFLILSDLGANARILLGRQLPYDAPDRKTPDTLNNRPNLSARNVLGPGVEINVLGDGTRAGVGGGGLGRVVIQSWGLSGSGALTAFPGFVRTTQSVGTFRLLQGDFVGGIEIDKQHVGAQTSAGVQLVSIRGAWGGTLTAEGVVGSFSAADFPGSIDAGAMKTLKLRGAFSGRVTLSSQTLGVGDVRDGAALIADLAAHSDSVSAFLWSNFPAATKTAVLAAQSDSGNTFKRVAALTALLPDLNRLLNGSSLLEEVSFGSVILSDSTADLESSDHRGAEVIRLNRLVLGDAYREAGPSSLSAFQEAPAPLAVPLNKVKVTGAFTGTLVSESAIKSFILTNAFSGSVAAASIGKLTAPSFLNPTGQKSIEATSGPLGVITATTGFIKNYRIDAGDQKFGGLSITRSGLVGDAVGIENVSIVAASIGNISVSLTADRSAPTVTLTGIRNSTFESTVGGIGSILSSHAIEGSLFAAKTNIGGLTIKAGGLDNADFLAGIDLGDDHAVGGAGTNQDTIASGSSSSIGAITITGAVNGAVIGAGYSPPPTDSLDSLLGRIARLVITGPATGSVVAAADFTTAPKVNNLAVNPHTHPQFRTV